MSHIFPRHTKQLPPVAIRGEGCYLYDETGKQYLDASGGAAVSCLGHGYKSIIDAVKAHPLEALFKAGDQVALDLTRGGRAQTVFCGHSDAVRQFAVKSFADHQLRFAVAVARRHVEQRDHGIHGGADGGDTFVPCRFTPQLTDAAAAQGQGADRP